MVDPTPPVLENFVLGPTIGKGSFGKVKVAMHGPTGQKVAVKMMRKDLLAAKGVQHKVAREVAVLRALSHPLIVRLYQVIETKTDVFLVMEYASGGELFDYITDHWPLKRSIVRFLFQQLIVGIEHLHRHFCVHRDLKPENLLLDSKLNLKIADFGLSTRCSDGLFLNTACGTPNYAAPEVLTGKVYSGPEVDVWSCGVILYTIECGRLPFEEADGRELVRRVCSAQYVIPPDADPVVRDLLRQLLCVDPVHRLTIPQIKRHRLFREKLPLYLARLAAPLPGPSINEDILRYTCGKLRVSMEHGRRRLLDGSFGAIWTCYHILAGAKAKLEPRDFAYMKPTTGAREHKVYGLRPSPPMEALYAEEGDFSSRGTYSRGLQMEPTSALQLARQLHTRFKAKERWQTLMRRVPRYDCVNNWRLGIFSGYPAMYVWQKVYTALKGLHMEWKVLAPFHLRCRTTTASFATIVPMRKKWSASLILSRLTAVPADPRSPSTAPLHPPITVTVGLQLFRVARYGYLLDSYCGTPDVLLPTLEVLHALHLRIGELLA